MWHKDKCKHHNKCLVPWEITMSYLTFLVFPSIPREIPVFPNSHSIGGNTLIYRLFDNPGSCWFEEDINTSLVALSVRVRSESAGLTFVLCLYYGNLVIFAYLWRSCHFLITLFLLVCTASHTPVCLDSPASKQTERRGKRPSGLRV